MNKTRRNTITVVTVLLLLAGAAMFATGPAVADPKNHMARGSAVKADAGKSPHPQTTCPIMGGRINKNYSVDAAGQRIYVCCPGCISKVRKDPEKALATLASRGEYAESLQKTCPVMGKKVDRKLFVDYKGRRIYVCCRYCLKKVRQDPARYAKMVADQVIKSSADASRKRQLLNWGGCTHGSCSFRNPDGSCDTGKCDMPGCR